MKVYGIDVDFSNDANFTPFARNLLMRYYARKGDLSPQQIFARACVAWSTYRGQVDLEMAQFMYNAVNKRWFMFSSPLASNTPDINPDLTLGKSNGFPISCFLGYVPDTVLGLIDHSSEFRMLSVMGGGFGGHWSDVRSNSEKSPGVIPFVVTMNADVEAYRQGKTRKGSYAAYLSVDHPDIWEFLTIRVPTGADVTRKALDIHNAVCFTNRFMDAVVAGTDYELIDPKHGPTGKMLNAREVWEKCLALRERVGEPFMWFTENANANLPPTQKAKGLRVNGGNLCTEISLPTNGERTAVCCLMSVNLEKFDEWCDTDLVRYAVRMLDNVLEYFIERGTSQPFLQKAVFSASQERAIGLGRMGFAYYLQQNGIPYDSQEAAYVNTQTMHAMYEKAVEESRTLAVSRGEPPDMIGTGMRNSRLFAVAPNANSGMICNTSPADEPVFANVYGQRSRGGILQFRNPYLERELETLGMNNNETWAQILADDGSVRNIDIPEHVKEVFKTASEVPQEWILIHAANRQRTPHMQAQSVNLFPNPDMSAYELEKLHRMAWELGLPSLYYLRSRSSVRTDNVDDGHHFEEISLMPNDEIVVISGNNCQRCESAKAVLKANDVPFKEVNIHDSELSLGEITGVPGLRTLPAIMKGGEYIGSLEAVNTLVYSDVEADDTDCPSCQA